MDFLTKLLNRRNLIFISVIVSALILVTAYSYFIFQKKDTLLKKQNDLEMVAALKSNQISEWYIDQINDAGIISRNKLLINNILGALSENSSSSISQLKYNLEELLEEHDLQNVLVVSPKMKQIAAVYETELDSVLIKHINHSLKTGTIGSTDLYLNPNTGRPDLNIVAPIIGENKEPAAVIIFQIDPENFLYPYLKSWPIISRTSETLLIRKEENSVLFVNELKHKKDTALKLKIPSSMRNVPAIMAWFGKTGIVEGEDYRGTSVLADIIPIEGTDWIMIAKTDKSEIFADLWITSTLLIISSVVSILLILTGISFIYKYRQSATYKNLLLKEQELRESVELFKTTLYSIGDGVITTDNKGNVRNMNIVAENLSGWKEAEASGKRIENVFKIINEEDRETVDNPVARVLAEGKIVGLANHTLLISRDGKEIPIADSGAPIKDENGTVIGVVLVFRDQIEERKSKQELEESRDILLESQKVAQLGNFLWDLKTGKWSSSKILDEIFGIDESFERTLEGWASIVHPDWQKEMINYVNEEVLKKHKKFDKEYKIVRISDGAERWVHGLAELRFEADNSISSLVGTISDITERKLSETELKESQERIRAIFDAAPLPMIIVDENTSLISVNKGVEKVFNKRADELLNLQPGDALNCFVAYNNENGCGNHPDCKICKMRLSVKEVFANGQPIRNREVNVTFVIDGVPTNLWLNLSAEQVFFDNKKHVIVGFNDITSRKNAEIELQESENKFKQIFNTIPDAVGISRVKDGIIIDKNEGFEKITGYTRDDFEGKTNDDLNIMVNDEDKLKLLDEINKNGSVYNAEVKIRRKNGKIFTGLMSATIINIKGEQHLLSVTKDIDEIKKVQKELEVNEERYRNLVEGSPSIFYRYSNKRGGVYWSSKITELLGYQPDQIYSDPFKWRNSILEEYQEELTRAIEDGCKGKPYDLTYKIEDVNGKVHWFNDKFIGRIIADDEIILEGLASDITENVEADLKLKESEKLFRNAFVTSPDSININRLEDGLYVNINSGFTEITGYTEEEVIGKTSKEIDIWVDHKEREKLVAGLKEYGTVKNLEAKFRMKNGRIITGLMSASVITLNGIPHILSITRDISDLKEIELSLKESEEKHRIVADHTSDWIYWLDQNGEYRYIAPSVVNVTGYSQFDFKNNPGLIVDIIHEEDREDNRAHFERLNEETSLICTKEFRIVAKNNEVRWIYHRCRAVYDKSGKFLGRRASNRDITILKEAEQKLIESERRYRSFFENDLTGDYISTVDGELISCNQSFVDIFGYNSMEEALASNTNKIYKSENSRNDFLNLIREKKKLINYEYEYINMKGESIYLIENAIGIFNEEGDLERIQGYVFDNTKRKLAEIQLRESEVRFKNVVQNSQGVFFSIDKNGIFTLSEGNALSKLGLEPGQAVGLSAYEMYKDFPQIINDIKTALNGVPVNTTLNMPGVDFEIHYHPNYDNEGNIEGVIGLAFDITERLKQEQSIRKLSHAVEQSQVSIVITNIEGGIEYVNPKFEEITGYTKAEALGENPRILKSGELPKEEYIKMWDTLTKGKDWQGVFHNKKKNGELFWESANISPIKNSEGKITNYLAVKEDITEKVLAEEELTKYRLQLEDLVEERTDQLKSTNKRLAEEIQKQKEYEKKLHDHLYLLSTFVDSMPTAAFIKDSDSKYVEVNHAFEMITGKNKSEILGKTDADVFDENAAEILLKQDKTVLETKDLKNFNITLKSGKNELYLLVNKVIYKKVNGDTAGILGTFIDISDQKKLQDSIERSLLKERDLNELKSRFISMASHEFRTPLTSIRIFTDLISRIKEKEDKTKLAEYIDKIQSRVSYMTDLINDVLTVSRVETGKLKFTPEEIDLKQFFENVLNEFKLGLSEDHKLTFSCDAKTNKVIADSKLLGYMFSNLLTNAVKYSPEGGEINVMCIINKKEFSVTIEDHGIGMSETVLKNLYEPFLRGDNIGSIAGTGLGLSIIKKAVDLHNGEIDCESELQKGTKFKIVIPQNRG